ncbi:nitronate monooxygenase [Nonomuraea sp. NPDC005983]|uniref:nitronate monooxygenase n=1 Tax=Nonomuraea sp. NPDC005983 TaxID=3155595 RepID=UPI0033BE2254
MPSQRCCSERKPDGPSWSSQTICRLQRLPNRSSAAIDLPIVQAPVGSAVTPELVAAVSNAGGLGSISWSRRAGRPEDTSEARSPRWRSSRRWWTR